MERIRILVAEEHGIFRETLCRFLEAEPGFEVIGEAGDGEELVRQAIALKPDVILMDVIMPKLNGIEATKRIKSFLPTVAILILTAHSYEIYVLAVLKAGAAGFLSKGARGKDLVAAIKAVRIGEPVVDQTAAFKILTRLLSVTEPNRRGALDEMHERELEVLRLAAKGMTNRQIADQLSISERTVQTHFINIFRKLDVGSRTEAVLRSLKEGWLSMEDLP